MNISEENIPQIDIISVVSEIIRKFERYNATEKNIESQEVAQKVLELQKRMEEARTQIKQIPGIDQSKPQQLEHLENLKKQLVLKQELINNDKLIEQLSDSYLMRRAAQMMVSVFYRTKAIAQEQKLDELVDHQKFKSILEKFQNNIKEEVQKAKQELESKNKK